MQPVQLTMSSRYFFRSLRENSSTCVATQAKQSGILTKNKDCTKLERLLWSYYCFLCRRWQALVPPRSLSHFHDQEQHCVFQEAGTPLHSLFNSQTCQFSGDRQNIGQKIKTGHLLTNKRRINRLQQSQRYEILCYLR